MTCWGLERVRWDPSRDGYPRHMSTDESQPLDVSPAYELVVNRLRKAIHLGTLRPGDKLPPERLHAVQLGVARVTLRGAIRVLESEGLIRISRGATGGAQVVEKRVPKELLRQELAGRIDELQAIVDFRLANERCAAERAASRVTPEDLEALELSIVALKASTSTGEFRQADTMFHLHVAKMAQSPLLYDAVETGRVAMFMPLDLLDLELMHAESLRAHRRILNALKEGSAKKAGRAMEQHLSRTRTDLEQDLGLV